MSRLLFAIVIGLSIFSTSLPVWGAVRSIDRRPLVRQMFVLMPGFIDFLYGSKSFRKNLSAGETKVLGAILGLYTESQWQRSPEIAYEFSSDRDSFKLGGQERTAMTSVLRTDPIVFNEGLIQSPSFSFEALDLLQLLVHELGRKIPNVNMDDVEKLAVKVRLEFESYTQSQSMNDNVRLVTITPPMQIQPISFGLSRAMPFVMIESFGVYMDAPLKLEFFRGNTKRFFVDHDSLFSAGYPSGNFQSRLSYRFMAPTLTENPDGGFKLSMPLEVQENFAIMGVDLGPLVPLPGSDMMRGSPQYSDLAPPARSTVDLKWDFYPSDRPPQDRENQAYLHPDFPALPEEFSRDASGMVAEIRLNGETIEGRISSREPIKSVHLIAGDALLPLGVSADGEIRGKVKWPERLSSSFIREVLVNFETRVPLTRSIPAPSGSDEPRVSRIAEPEVLYEGQWKPFKDLAGSTVPRKIRMRIKSAEPLRQVQLDWTAPRVIRFKGVKAGEFHEAMRQLILKTESRGEFQEFDVHFEDLPSWPVSPNREYADSKERVLSALKAIGESGAILTFQSRSDTFRDRPFFHLSADCEHQLTILSDRKK